VTFDTTVGTNKEYMPFGTFLGLNQFREPTIFGAALFFMKQKTHSYGFLRLF
jgi:zinc finger SWIM domain-containing protein 3